MRGSDLGGSATALEAQKAIRTQEAPNCIVDLLGHVASFLFEVSLNNQISLTHSLVTSFIQ
ncbi:MAG: hypothetical protein A2162_10035 [Deltaproteobacteria bacterium RBG_13_52_11b]|nr:MAG: hypothetical protein A2162_10035 [Deltaproteobacteria bacterium RBG_13_52_11b]